MDPRREGAMETLRAIDQATARIDALIERAGGPMMICRDTQESEDTKQRNTIDALFDMGDYKNGGDLTVWIRELTDTIDRLEAALANALLQRDQLLCDLKRIADVHSTCMCCLHNTEAGDEEACLDCSKTSSKWVWRGVTEAETDEDTD